MSDGDKCYSYKMTLKDILRCNCLEFNKDYFINAIYNIIYNIYFKRRRIENYGNVMKNIGEWRLVVSNKTDFIREHLQNTLNENNNNKLNLFKFLF
jgi:hypothetical protein